MHIKSVLLFILLLLFGTGSVFATNGDSDTNVKGSLSYDKKEGKPKVFIEGIRLDFDYMRRKMGFVDFVNDPAVSDVHIIISSLRSGSGGEVYSLMYNNKTFENLTDFTITCSTLSSDTYEEERKTITDALTMGSGLFNSKLKTYF